MNLFESIKLSKLFNLNYSNFNNKNDYQAIYTYSIIFFLNFIDLIIQLKYFQIENN